MTKLMNVVRGVEVKEFDKEPDCITYSDGVVVGNNSLASAEVVVDKQEVAESIQDFYIKRDGSCLIGIEELDDLAKAVTTALASGSIISLKGEETK